MSKKECTNIYYHVPEDMDSPQQPNFFTIPESKTSLRLEHIYEYFPLRGTYIFRFKLAYDGLIVWLDVNDLSARLPTFKESIVIKANRISWEQSKLNLVKTAKDSFKIAEVKQVKKESVNLFDHHEEANHRYGSSHSAKVAHQDILGGNTAQSGQANLLDGFGVGHVSQPINFFDQSAGKKGKASQSLMGFDKKHSDLI